LGYGQDYDGDVIVYVGVGEDSQPLVGLGERAHAPVRALKEEDQ
jgi:hypothetical protein